MMKWFESNHFVNKTYVKKKKLNFVCVRDEAVGLSVEVL